MHVEGFESMLMEGLCTTGYLGLNVFQGYFYLNLYFIQNAKKNSDVMRIPERPMPSLTVAFLWPRSCNLLQGRNTANTQWKNAREVFNVSK